MAGTPLILCTGSTSGAGSPGIDSQNRVIGETLTFSDANLGNSGASYFWTLDDSPIGSAAALASPSTATPTLVPDVTGTYVVTALVNGTFTATMMVAVSLDQTGARIPSFLESGPPDATGWNGGGNVKGWHEAMTVFMRQVDSLLGSTSPLTTKGDLFGYSTVDARIPIGTDGQVLTADSAQALGLKWATPTTGTVTGTGAANRIATWSSASALTSSANFTFDGTTLTTTGNQVLSGTFSAGGAKFTTDANGNLTKVNNVTYSWPASQGAASTVLTNNGSGTLTWASAGTLSSTGSPASGQVATWSGASTLTGTSGLTFSAGTFAVTGAITATTTIVATGSMGSLAGDVTSLNSGGAATVNANGAGAAVYSGFRIFSSSVEKWFMGRDGTSSTDDWILRGAASTDVMRVILASAVANTIHVKAGGVGFGVTTEAASTLTFADPWNLVFGTSTGTKIGTDTTQKIGFYNATPVVQPTNGANLTNNVTSGGSSDVIADFTDLTIYANDAATIRNDIFQLARKLKVVNDSLRTLGLNS